MQDTYHALNKSQAQASSETSFGKLKEPSSSKFLSLPICLFPSSNYFLMFPIHRTGIWTHVIAHKVWLPWRILTCLKTPPKQWKSEVYQICFPRKLEQETRKRSFNSNSITLTMVRDLNTELNWNLSVDILQENKTKIRARMEIETKKTRQRGGLSQGNKMM